MLAIATYPASSGLIHSVDSWFHLDQLPSHSHVIGEGRFLQYYLTVLLERVGDGDVVSPTVTILAAVAIYATVIARAGSEFVPAAVPQVRVVAAMAAAAVPFAVEFFFFSASSVVIAVGVALCTMGVVVQGTSPRRLALGVGLIAAGLATYQNGLNFAAVVLAGYVIVPTARDGWEGFRKGFTRALRGALVIAAGIAIWYVASRLVMAGLGVEPGERFGLLSPSDLPERFRQALGLLDDLYLREESYFRLGAKLALYLGLALAALGTLTRRRIPRVAAALGLLALSIPATTFGVQLVVARLGVSFRNFAHIALLVPVIIGATLDPDVLPRMRTERARLAAVVAAASLLALFVYGSTARMNALFVNQSRQDTVDHLIAADLVERARELEGWGQVDRVVISPCCFSGVGPAFAVDLPKRGPTSTRAISAFSQPWSAPYLMAEVSGRPMSTAEPADYAAGDLVCMDSPRYPDEGSIHIADRSLVVCRR